MGRMQEGVQDCDGLRFGTQLTALLKNQTSIIEQFHRRSNQRWTLHHPTWFLVVAAAAEGKLITMAFCCVCVCICIFLG
jgi:hypothetical protein